MPARAKPSTSANIDRIDAELQYAGDREEIERISDEVKRALRLAELPEVYFEYVEVGRAQKKNFAQRFSTALAQKVADALRPRFKGIMPLADGTKPESFGRGAGGLKKLDVNYWPGPTGLGLSVSIKTLNFPDFRSGRYTKNMRRMDGELRAEASDLHRFSPYAVLAALILLPLDAAHDAKEGRSSLKHAWDVFRRRAGRVSDKDDIALFEAIFIGVYSTGKEAGAVRFFDLATEFPDRGLPESPQSFSTVLSRIEAIHRARH
ncbi:MAG TPA: hypothetical protein VF601_02310 [Beijerinckiaceae bacterium]